MLSLISLFNVWSNLSGDTRLTYMKISVYDKDYMGFIAFGVLFIAIIFTVMLIYIWYLSIKSKKSEKLLTAQSEWLKSLMANVKSAVFIMNEDENIIFVNNKGLDILGTDEKSVLKKAGRCCRSYF